MESDKRISLNAMNGEGDSTTVICSICLDPITNAGERSLAKLQCGHEFHLAGAFVKGSTCYSCVHRKLSNTPWRVSYVDCLPSSCDLYPSGTQGGIYKKSNYSFCPSSRPTSDCIGSAFNMKGTMQCPNCRRIETGQWLYGNASTSSPPARDAQSTNTGPYNLSFTETPYRVHVCPFRGLPQVHPYPEPSLGIMSTMTPMVSHQHPGGSGPHPHGWIQFHHTPFQGQHPLPPSLPMPIGYGSGRFDSQRSLPRFIPPSRVYDQSGGFSLYGETPINYSHSWVRDNHPHFPLQ